MNRIWTGYQFMPAAQDYVYMYALATVAVAAHVLLFSQAGLSQGVIMA